MKEHPTERDLESPLGIADEPITTTAADHIPDEGTPESRRKRMRALGEDGIDHHSTGLGDILADEHDGYAGGAGVSVAARPGPTVMGLAEVDWRPEASKRMVRWPAGPPSARFVKVALPVASVRASRVPVRTPPWLASTATIWRP